MLQQLEGRGWVQASPPLDVDENSVIARHKGRPIKAGFTMEEREGDGEMYCKFRSGKYDVELKLDLAVGQGQLRVEEASGYDS